MHRVATYLELTAQRVAQRKQQRHHGRDGSGTTFKLYLSSTLQFQGRWYAIGVAESDIHIATERQLEMFSTTFELIGNDSYSVTGLMPT